MKWAAVRPVRMFVSYSHENAVWCKRLQPVLKVKANVDTLQLWHDTELKAGDCWEGCHLRSLWSG